MKSTILSEGKLIFVVTKSTDSCPDKRQNGILQNCTVLLLMTVALRLPDVLTFTSTSIKGWVEFHKRISVGGRKQIFRFH